MRSQCFHEDWYLRIECFLAFGAGSRSSWTCLWIVILRAIKILFSGADTFSSRYDSLLCGGWWWGLYDGYFRSYQFIHSRSDFEDKKSLLLIGTGHYNIFSYPWIILRLKWSWVGSLVINYWSLTSWTSHVSILSPLRHSLCVGCGKRSYFPHSDTAGWLANFIGACRRVRGRWNLHLTCLQISQRSRATLVDGKILLGAVWVNLYCGFCESSYFYPYPSERQVHWSN